METWEARLALVQRPHPTVDGWPYDGEILRFSLDAGRPPAAAPHDGEGEDRRTLAVEVRLTRSLLASRGWCRLLAREVALVGHAFVRETLQHEGLPEHDRVVLVLDTTTQQGAYLDGPPWPPAEVRPDQPFAVPVAARASLS